MHLDPRQWSEAERWLVHARLDIAAVAALLAAEPAAIAAAAFHCQQAAEKFAKALLVAVKIRPPKFHSIKVLVHSIRPYFPLLAKDISLLADTTLWYIASRYPDADVEETPAVEAVRAVLEQLRKLDREIAKLAPQ